MKKRTKMILYGLSGVLPLVAALFVLLAAYVPPFHIYPSSEKYEIGPVEDLPEHANSVVHTLSMGDRLRFEYTIGSKAAIPYAGFYFRFSQGPEGIDARAFDYLKLTIQAEKATSVKLNLKYFLEGFTRLSDPQSFYPLEYELVINSSPETYIIPLDRFHILYWWFEFNGISADWKMEGYADDLYNFQLLNGSVPHNVRDSILIRDISLHKSYHCLGWGTAACLTIYYLLLAGFIIFIKIRQTTGKSRKRESHGDEELEAVLSVMREKFKDPEFSIWEVNRSTGLSNRKISAKVKTTLEQSFTQLLNDLRIEEATRLLRTTDMKATDIAFNVGYNNYTHFTREFKKRTGVSAQKYRHGDKPC